MGVFFSCNNLITDVISFDHSELENTIEEHNTPLEKEYISLNEYYCSENGYSLVFYRYNNDEQEVDLIFDSNCMVRLYDVFYEDSFNGNEDIECYIGYVDKNEKYQFEIMYNKTSNKYSIAAGVGGEKIFFDKKCFSGEYVFKQTKMIEKTQIEILIPSSYSFQIDSNSELNNVLDFGEYSGDKIFNIIPNSFELYGRMSLDKVSYTGTNGGVPFDPYRLTIGIQAKKNNIYFIQKIYMDVLVFDKYGESIKEYHEEYEWENVENNLKLIERFGFDTLYPPTNDIYKIRENWIDFPQNAYSVAVLLSFDIFSNRDHGYTKAGEGGFSITVPAYEVRHIGPQVFDSFVNINEGIFFEHH